MEQLNELWNSTKMFNNMADNFSKPKGKFIPNQMNLIVEEVDETINAIEANDLVELLDGCVDILVTTFGMLQFLEAQSIDVKKAFELVARNNNSKFVFEEARLEATIKHYKETLDIDCDFVYNLGYQRYAIRNKQTGKIMKPVGFQPVDLRVCIPRFEDLG